MSKVIVLLAAIVNPQGEVDVYEVHRGLTYVKCQAIITLDPMIVVDGQLTVVDGWICD